MYQYIILNNYQIGAKLKSMPTEKIIIRSMIDSNHTKIVFKDLTPSEINLINKLSGTHKLENY